MRLAYLLFFSTLDTELLLAKSKQNQRQVYIERSFRRVLDPEIHLLTLEEKANCYLVIEISQQVKHGEIARLLHIKRTSVLRFTSLMNIFQA